MTDITVTTVPFSKLVATDAINARGKTKQGLDELAAAIAAKGLIQPLAVRPGDKADSYEVIDGRRRYQAIAKLVKDKLWKKTDPVPVIVRNEDDAAALETSLMANTVRLPMHAVDQHDVFVRLVDQGAAEAEIAARFGISERKVRQQLALGRLAPVIRDAWRKGKITAEVAQAFTVADHDQQQKAWADLKGYRNLTDYTVRNALARDLVSVDDHRVVFVGFAAYVAAGGAVRESLFDEEKLIEDVALLDRLVRDKLAAEVARVRSDGWAWVALADDLPHRWPNSWRSWKTIKDGQDDYDAEGHYKPADYSPEERARSGVVLDLDGYEDDPMFYHAGIIRPAEDGQADIEDAVAAAGRPNRFGGDDEDDVTDWSNEAETGCEADGEDDRGRGESEPVESGPFVITDALRQTVSEALTVAVAGALSADVGLAMRLMTAALECRFAAPAAITNNGHASVRQRGTREFAAVFDELLAADETTARKRFSAAVGATLDLTHGTWRFKSRDSGVERLRDACPPVTYLAAARAAFLPDDYFKRATKDVALAAIEEMREAGAAGGLAPEDVMAGMKKTDLAAAAAQAAKDCGWLPPELRNGAYALIVAATEEAA